MPKDEDRDVGVAAGGASGRAAGGVPGVRPRDARSGAQPVRGESAGQQPNSRWGAGVRLTGHSQHLPVGGGRRRGSAGSTPRARARLGEPDGILWSRLGERDRRVLELVAEHGVLTTWQLLALVFPSPARAQRRLRELAELGVLFRTQPHRAGGGSTPFHYLLGYRGACLLAARAGGSPPRPSAHADRITRALESPTLRHLLGTNQFFADLAAYERGLGTGRVPTPVGEGLRLWHSEAWLREHYRPVVRADGYGVWVERGRRLGFFLEYDTGSESLRTVAAKLEHYTGRHHDTARALTGMILFWVASRRREQGLRKALWAARGPVPVATASRDHGDQHGPAGAIWSVVTAQPGGARRVRLGELPDMIGGTEPDGTPTVLPKLPEPDEDADEYWTAIEDADLADTDDDR